MLIFVIPLALVAALLYALSDFLEQRAAQRANARPVDPSLHRHGGPFRGLLGRLIRDRRWILGWAVGTLAYLVQAAGLHLGSVTVVQSLQVTTLLFALPLSTIHRPERVGVREWIGGGAVCLGLLGFLLSRAASHAGSHADRGRLLPLIVLLAIIVLVLVAVAVSRSGVLRATLLAVAAGTAFASSATLVKLTTNDLTNVGVVGTATDWPGYALALAAAAGLVLQQAAFASGKLPTATTAMVVMNPVVGSIVAVYAFHEGLPQAPPQQAALAAGALAVICGVAILARSPLLGAETPADQADHPDQADGSDRPDPPDRDAQTDQADHADRDAQTDRAAQAGHADQRA